MIFCEIIKFNKKIDVNKIKKFTKLNLKNDVVKIKKKTKSLINID